MEYAFNVTFTRPDEDHANVYTIGYNAYGTSVTDLASAEAQVRRHFSHLKVSKVALFAVLNEDGDTIVSGQATDALTAALQVITKDASIRAFLEANDPKALEQARTALQALGISPDPVINRAYVGFDYLAVEFGKLWAYKDLVGAPDERIEVTSYAQVTEIALANGGNFLVSSSVDFPEEGTKDPAVIALCNQIRG